MEVSRAGLPILAFTDAEALTHWLAEQGPDHPGIWLKLAKKNSGIASVTQRDAVDAGLCHGWIDGLINRFDDLYYLIRFTPRRPRSKWSQINVERAEALMAVGRVEPGGRRAIDAAKADGRWDAAYPPASRITVPDDFRQALDDQPEAGAFFATLTGADRYAILFRLHDVADPDRRAKTISRLVRMLFRRETL